MYVAKKEIEVSFTIQNEPCNKRDLVGYTIVPFYLNITIKFDKTNDSHNQHIDYLLKEQSEEYEGRNIDYCTGFLTQFQRYAKFNIPIDHKVVLDFYAFSYEDEGDSCLDISFPISKVDVSLQTLSMIEDVISYFKVNNIAIPFTTVDIINEIVITHKKLQLDENACAKTLRNLLNMMSNHKIDSHSAILLTYCFAGLEFCDSSLAFIPDDMNGISSIISQVIDKVFEIKTKDENNANYYNALEKFIKKLNLCQRIQLFRPALHQPADDGLKYNWNYTEWTNFFNEIKFSIDNLGKVYIDVEECSKDAESVYSQMYGVDAENYAIFEQELKAIAPLIGLSYQWNVQFRYKIVFAEFCSQKLFNMKLYLDVDILKQLVKARNNYRFFEQVKKTGDFKGHITQGTLLEELVKKIFSMALGSMCAPLELDSSLHVGRALESHLLKEVRQSTLLPTHNNDSISKSL